MDAVPSTTAEVAAALNELAREVIDTNAYLTLGTIEPDGSPRLSPVYYGVHGYADFYWVSSPASQHSRNIADRDRVSLVVFDSSVPVGGARAVYLGGHAREVPAGELAEHVRVAFRTLGGGRALTPDELRQPAAHRLYVARATRCEVHIGARHPTLGTGVDRRLPADPTAPAPRGPA